MIKDDQTRWAVIKKPLATFHHTGWLIGILVLRYYNGWLIWMFPKIGGFPPNHPSCFWLFHYKQTIHFGVPLFFENTQMEKKTTKRIAPENIPLPMERSLPSSNFQGQAISVREGIVCLSFKFNITHDASMGRFYVYLHLNGWLLWYLDVSKYTIVPMDPSWVRKKYQIQSWIANRAGLPENPDQLWTIFGITTHLRPNLLLAFEEYKSSSDIYIYTMFFFSCHRSLDETRRHGGSI